MGTARSESQILLLPGPTPIPPRVLRAIGAPMINHRGPAFKAMLEEITGELKEIFQTQNDVLILTCSGTGGMEAAVANTLSPGDKALVISIGAFGERFAKICKAYGVQAEVLDYPWGTAANPDDIARRLAEDQGHEIRAILVQHNETSTGVLNDLEAISKARGDHPALLIVDSVSGMVAADIKTDAWGLDVVITGAQKAFMIPPGLAMVSVSSRAWERIEACRNSRFYFDFKAYKEFYSIGQTPFTPAVATIYGLYEALKMLKEEGLSKAQERHALYRAMVRAGVRALGLELVASDAVASPAVTTVRAPSGISPGTITRLMREKYNVVIAGGQGKLKDTTFRIGHLGYVQVTDLLAAIAALELVLEECGLTIERGAGVRAAQEVIAQSN
ncbi:MAG: alanine--glyoxylate aminotransferase family protein [Clostridia bacterium]|nr:alanine--glyoxylate aminotransferase family protein [Clostridia bacterium]